jgi:hypothetical protein
MLLHLIPRLLVIAARISSLNLGGDALVKGEL